MSLDAETVTLPEAPPLAVPPSADPVTKTLFKLDLACGQVCQEGFQGVDIAPCEGVKYVVDLSKPAWPFEDDSVDEARSSHFLEHLNGLQQVTFMNELYRILKPGAGCIIVTPYGWHNRAWQDPTHRRPMVFESYLYHNKPWRDANKLTHGPYAALTSDFDCRSMDQQIADFWSQRNAETRAWAAGFMVNVVPDLGVLVVKPAESRGGGVKPEDRCQHKFHRNACPYCERLRAAQEFIAAMRNRDGYAAQAQALVNVLDVFGRWE